MSLSLNIPVADAAIVLPYLLAVMAFGRWVGRGQRTSADYFLGSRSLPWGALLLSIVATETSTVTFLSLPGIAAATHGTDQLMVQRYLSARNRRDASKALAVSGFVVFGQFAVFAAAGALLTWLAGWLIQRARHDR